MHMAGCTCGDPIQLMMTIHYACLQNDLSAEFIVAHAEFIIATQGGK